MKSHVLVVDDEFTVRQTIKLILGDDYHILEAANEGQAMHILSRVKVDIVLLDIHLKESNGIDLLAKLRTAEPDILVIMVTVEQNVHRVVECMKLGAFDYITKPFTENELMPAIRRAKTELDLKQARNFISWEVGEQAKMFDMVGNSKAMNELYQQIEQISRVDTSILIIGETGVGKEMVARALHRVGKRSQKPFIAVNCAAIPITLLESELFGYEPGAFTGAKERKKGMFELANEGTIFLDEISELSLDAQVKLLRVLQSGDFNRLGGTQTIYTDVVVYATSNKSLEEMIGEKKFREDLFYRLNVVGLRVPPLRERKDDVPLLIKHFIDKHSRQLKTPLKTVNPEALEYLKSHMHWNGNVRELENLVLRALIFSRGNDINLADFTQSKSMRPNIEELSPFIMQQINAIPLTKKDLENLRKGLMREVSTLIDRHFIERLSNQFNGNIADITEVTGIHRTYMYKMISKAGLKPEIFKNTESPQKKS